MKGSDDISKLLKIIEVTFKDNTIVQDYKDIFTKDKLTTVKALGSFIKTVKWDYWTEQHNILPGIIGIIEEIFKKMEELEKLGSHSKVRVYGSDFGKYIFKMFKDFSYKINE